MKSKWCELIHWLDLNDIMILQILYRKANLKEVSTIFVSFILMLPVCLGRQEINERKIALALIKFLL